MPRAQTIALDSIVLSAMKPAASDREMIKCFIAVLLGRNPIFRFATGSFCGPALRRLGRGDLHRPLPERGSSIVRQAPQPIGLSGSRCACYPTARVHSRLPAGNFRRPARTIDASKGRTVWCRVSGDIEIGCIALFRPKPGARQESKARDRVEGRFRFAPLDAGVLDPEVGVPMLAPICHLVGIEKLNAKIETAHRAIFPEVPDQLVLQALRITPLQWARRIVRGWRSRILDDVDWPVTKRYGAPIAQLLVRPDCLACLQLRQSEGPQRSQLVSNRQRPQPSGLVRCRQQLHGR